MFLVLDSQFMCELHVTLNAKTTFTVTSMGEKVKEAATSFLLRWTT